VAQEYAGRLRRQAILPRILTAAVGIPLVLGALWLGGRWWLYLAAVILALALWEYGPLRALRPRSGGATVLALGGLIAFYLVASDLQAATGWALGAWGLLVLGLGLLPLLRSGLTPASEAPPQWQSVLLGIAYLATPFAFLVRWRWEFTPRSVLAFLIVIWANDIAAYFVGLAIGRHKLAPRVSPGKSWEGALGGLAGGVAAGLLLAPWLDLGAGPAAAWAAIVTAVSQAGDLFESALKRRAGVKDSGRLLPGHGGVLDRFDGILMAAPAGYVLLRMLAAR
jgi:phosphatidate cytidylyltransferase